MLPCCHLNLFAIVLFRRDGNKNPHRLSSIGCVGLRPGAGVGFVWVEESVDMVSIENLVDKVG